MSEGSYPDWTPFSAIQHKEVEWVVPGVPRGMVTVLAGRPKVGKSMLTAWWSAVVSFEGHNTVLVSAEDAPEYVTKARLLALEANTERVFYAPAFALGNGSSSYLISQIEQHRPRLLIFDPFTAMMAEASNSWSDQHVRRIIAPLADIAQTLDVAVVYVLHLRKGSSTDPLEAIGGSVGLGAAPRSVLMFGRDPEHPEDMGRRLLAHVACNVDEEGPTRVFELQRILVPNQAGPDIATARLHFAGLSSVRADGMLRLPDSDEERSDIDNAKLLLRETLWSSDGVATRDIETMLRAHGISKSTEERARRQLGVEAVKRGSAWFLRLPDAVTKEALHGGLTVFP